MVQRLTKRQRRQARRKKIKKVFTGAAIVAVTTSLAAGAVKVAGAARERRARIITERIASFRQTQIANPEQWARIAPVYKWQPMTNSEHRHYINTVNAIAKKANVTPLDVLRTIEMNTIDKYKLQGIRNKINGENRRLAAFKGKSKGKRSERIKIEDNIMRLKQVEIILDSLVNSDDPRAREMIKKIRKAEGSKRALDRLLKWQRAQQKKR